VSPAAEAAGALVVALPLALGLAAAPAPPGGGALFTFADPAIVESSGLVVDGRLGSGALVATVNDSGDAARVFVVDPATGRTVGGTAFATPDGEQPDDVEALAPAGPGRVWVADIGDNAGTRAELLLHEVPVGRGERAVDAPPLRVSYPDGPHDAETLLRHPRTGRLLVVTKSVLGGVVHALPRGAGAGDRVVTRPVGRVLGLATDGAFWPDGRHLVVRNYSAARVYSWPELEPVGDLPLPSQRQGEGLAVDGAGRVVVSSEGLREPVLEVRVPPRLRAALEGTRSPSSDGPGGEDPAAPPGRRWPWGLGVAAAAVAGWVVSRRGRRR
jgi:hypothetical protein